MKKIAIILVAYDQRRVGAAIRYLHRISASKRLIVVNNKELFGSGALDSYQGGWEQIQGSNSAAEFSGWQEGLTYLDQNETYDLYIFANDTVVTHRRYTWIRHFAFQYQIRKSTPCIGFINTSSINFKIEEVQFNRWISTYLFCLSNEVLHTIKRRIDNSESVKKYITESLHEDHFFAPGLCRNLHRHLTNWLFRGKWYASQALTADTQAFFQRKALAILNEKYLSASLISHGVLVNDPLGSIRGLSRLDRFARSKRILLMAEPDAPF